MVNEKQAEAVNKRCFELQKTCNSYQEFLLKCAIENLDETMIYTESQFDGIHKLYVTYFRYLSGE